MTGTLRGVANKHCLLSFFSFFLLISLLLCFACGLLIRRKDEMDILEILIILSLGCENMFFWVLTRYA